MGTPYVGFWKKAWDVCFIIFCHLLHIRSGKTGNLFSSLLCSLWWVRFSWQIVFVCLYSTPSHYHHCANLSEDIELIKCLSDIYLSSVWVRINIFSQLPIINYVGLCVLSLPISLMMLGSIYILCLIIIIKSDVWTITHCLWLGHETMVCAVYLSIFLWICDMAGWLRGTFVSCWYLPRIWPSVTDMQHYYQTSYPTDDWHLAYQFSLVYFPSKCAWKACRARQHATLYAYVLLKALSNGWDTDVTVSPREQKCIPCEIRKTGYLISQQFSSSYNAT